MSFTFPSLNSRPGCRSRRHTGIGISLRNFQVYLPFVPDVQVRYIPRCTRVGWIQANIDTKVLCLRNNLVCLFRAELGASLGEILEPIYIATWSPCPRRSS